MFKGLSERLASFYLKKVSELFGGIKYVLYIYTMKKKVTITITPEAKEMGKAKAKEKGFSFSTLIEHLIRNYKGKP